MHNHAATFVFLHSQKRNSSAACAAPTRGGLTKLLQLTIQPEKQIPPYEFLDKDHLRAGGVIIVVTATMMTMAEKS